MTTADYYKILEIPHTATEEDIRKSFRKLAFRYHPDKNRDDSEAEDHFKKVQEAYFVLSDPERREAWHLHSRYPLNTNKQRQSPITAQTILERSKRLRDHVAEVDVFRMSQEILFQQIMNLLSLNHISLLIQTGNATLNQQIIQLVIASSKSLDYRYGQQVNQRLSMIAGADNDLHRKLYENTRKKQALNYWKRYNVILIILLTILICFLIWDAS